MRKWIYLLSVVSIVTYTIGCKKADIQFGEQFIEPGYTNIVVVDTLTPVISTVIRDSTPTSQSGSLLIGSYRDPFFGKISANTFFVLSSPSGGIPDLHVSAVYDSLELQMRADSSFYGDTTVLQKFNVHRVTNTIEISEGLTYLFNTSNFSTESSSLGSANVLIRPSLKDSVKIRMSNTLGQELWGFVQNKSQQLVSAADFEHYFNGIKIMSDNADASILGFSDSVTMRLFYHESNPYAVQKYIDFVLTARNRQFNQVNVDRTGTALNIPVPENKEWPSALTSHTAFIQPLTGMVMKVTFPSLRSLLQRSDYIKIIRAELLIPPLKESYDYKYMLPAQLQASATDINNGLGGLLSLSGTTGSQSAQYGDLKIDWLYGENTLYTYDVTAYMQQQIAISGDNNTGLIFLPPSPAYSNRFNRLVVGDSENAKGNIKMKVYYVSVQPE